MRQVREPTLPKSPTSSVEVGPRPHRSVSARHQNWQGLRREFGLGLGFNRTL
jgi:hypothetical protein